ncbi:helix-turn-helix transcriptional regulator [Roseburia hominis]
MENQQNFFGDRVKQARKNAGLTQAELAEKVNMDVTTISRIENGAQFTPFPSMLNFSKALNVHFDYLICDYLEAGPDLSNPLDSKILDIISPLPDNYKLFILKEIQNLIQHFPTGE